MPFPAILAAEVKFTTGSSVQVEAREILGLDTFRSKGMAILGVLFWPEVPGSDDGWLLADVRAARVGDQGNFCASRESLLRATRIQPRLVDLRAHCRQHWRQILVAFHDEALAGLDTLAPELERCRLSGALRQRLPEERALDLEYRRTMEEVLRRQGESNTGRIVQALFANMMTLAGYQHLNVNQSGVPDFELSGLPRELQEAPPAVGEDDRVVVTRAQARRLVRHCRAAGDEKLARVLEAQLGARAGTRRSG